MTTQTIAKQEQRQPEVQQDKQLRNRTLVPPVDILEDEEGFRILADIPGVEKDAVDVKLEDQTLHLEATVSTSGAPEAIRRNYDVLKYVRSFRLGDGLNADAIQADLKNGVLTIVVPKAPQAQPKRITVQAN